MLTDSQVSQFRDEGYLFLPDTFTEEECAVLRDEAELIYRQNGPKYDGRNPAHRARRSPRTCTTKRSACWAGIRA